MLFNNIDLNVYEIEECYLLATSEDAALRFYAKEQNVHLEDIAAIYCDLQENGIHEDCDIDYAIEYIKNLKTDSSITVIRIDDKEYSLFINFKDFIFENMDQDWFKNIEKQPCVIAWNE